ncbi:MAG: transcription antitermination factor NusB [Clostridiaceae bacterium]|jgi:N utilization substance protein B|nr:transcription antitermination factor NusB [Clostridiaceae bacterium]
MSRRKSREAALLFLYQLEFRTDEIDPQKAIFLQEFPIQGKDLEYFNMIVDGVTAQKDELDRTYSTYLIGWKIDRIPKIDLVLLRIACFEILHIESIPKSVSISEAIILAKLYSTEEAKSYINAILGKIEIDAFESGRLEPEHSDFDDDDSSVNGSEIYESEKVE